MIATAGLGAPTLAMAGGPWRKGFIEMCEPCVELTAPQLDYIDLPLTLRLTTSPRKRSMLAGYLGASLAMLLAEGDDADDPDAAMLPRPITDKTLDASLVAGAEVSFPLGPGSILLDMRYQRHLSELSDDLDVGVHAFGLAVGYAFP